MDQDALYFRNMVAALEKRMDEDGEIRIKAEEETRRFIEQKLSGVHEKIKTDERS